MPPEAWVVNARHARRVTARCRRAAAPPVPRRRPPRRPRPHHPALPPTYTGRSYHHDIRPLFSNSTMLS